MGEWTAAADRHQPVLRLENVSVSSDHERSFAVGDRQHRLEPAQDAVRAPILGEFDRRAHEMTLVLLQLGFETFEQRKRIRRAAGKSCKYPVVMEPAHLARARLDHDVAERDL